MSTSFIFGLLIGCFIGSMGKHFVQKFTIDRQQTEKSRSKRNEWDKLCNEYPLFISQISKDINNPEYKTIREFFVVDKSSILNSLIPRLRYDLTEDMIQAVNRLEELDYIEKIENNCLLYKMREELITQLIIVDNVISPFTNTHLSDEAPHYAKLNG